MLEPIGFRVTSGEQAAGPLRTRSYEVQALEDGFSGWEAWVLPVERNA